MGILSGLKQAAKAVEEARNIATAEDRAQAIAKAAAANKAQKAIKASEAFGNLNLEGQGVVGLTQADRTRVGGSTAGGPLFSTLQLHDPKYAEARATWGVRDKPTASRLINESNPSKVWTTMLGAEDQLKTNPVVFDQMYRAFGNAVKRGDIEFEKVEQINDILRKAGYERADIANPNFKQTIADSFQARALVADLFQNIGIGGPQKAFGPEAKKILIKNTEPSLLHPEHGGDAPTFAAGPRIFSLDKTVAMRPDLNAGFPAILGGEDLGVSFAPVPNQTFLPDFWEKIMQSTGKEPGYMHLTRGIKGEGLPSQQITEEWLTRLQQAGYAEGGEVDPIKQRAAQRVAMHLAAEKHFAGGGSADSMQATPQVHPLLGQLADWVKQARDAIEPQDLPDTPTVGDIVSRQAKKIAAAGADFLGASDVPDTLTRIAYGEPLTTGKGMTTQLAPHVAESALAALPLGDMGIKAVRIAAKELGPKAAMMLEQHLIDQGLMMPITAWHGTPHKFAPTAKNPLGEFDASKMGTGEGAQVYGAGTYLAEAKEVGQQYKDALQGGPLGINIYNAITDALGVPYSSAATALSGNSNIGKLAGHGEEKIRNEILKVSDAMSKSRFDQEQLDAAAVRALADNPAVLKSINQSGGSLYKVDLPDELVAKMLDWDKPLSQQSPTVQTALEQTKNKQLRAMLDFAKTPYSEMAGGEDKTMGEAFRLLNMNLHGKAVADSPKAAALLSKQGISGIRYLDEHSRAAGKGTFNFVVFPGEEKALNILERNGEAAPKAVDRLSMNYKDVTKRTPILQEAAQALSRGELTADQYAALVREHKPVMSYASVPQPATPEEAINALTGPKKEMYGKTADIPAGTKTELRLDIPAYANHGVWVNSVHQADKPTVYGAVSSAKNVTMMAPQEKALKVAMGGPKAPFATMSGEWNPMTTEEAYAKAQKVIHDPEWSQVGFDPERHGYFYDRETMEPITHADEVIQIGPLVLARNARHVKPEGGHKYGAGGIVLKAAENLSKLFHAAPEAAKVAQEAKVAAYVDPATQKIGDWAWRDLPSVHKDVGLTEVPDYIQGGYGQFMKDQNARATAGQMNPRDFVKAYTTTRSSVNRGGLSHASATRTGMKLPNTGELVRPEGAYAEWLGSKMGQKYLDEAEQGNVHMPAIHDLVSRFEPFGMAPKLGEDMMWAAQSGQSAIPDVNSLVTAPVDEYRDMIQSVPGIGPAKSGFVASLLGRGDLPTFDARQIRLHTGEGGKEAAKYMSRGKGLGGDESVDRLAARQQAMDLGIDPELLPFYQHLVHHGVWDKVAGSETTHDDLIRAMRGYAEGGAVEGSK